MKKGFTLIELLVVVSLVGLLATLVLANLNSARQRGRDAQRKSDLRNLQTALRLYYNDRSTYPGNDSSGKIVACTSYASPTPCSWGSQWLVGTTVYMSALPADPITTQNYVYTRVDTDTYTIKACLENASDTVCKADSSCSSNCSYTVAP